MTTTTTFETQWLSALSSLRIGQGYEKSTAVLRSIVRDGLLRFTDLRDDPAKFFLAHRLLVDCKHRDAAVFIRTTVQFNLFGGTVLGLGSPEQVAILEVMQSKGQLGCFALTEKLAGVNSGLVVNTTATWIPQKQCFVLDSPNEAAHKNWISQGLVAEKAAVIADLRIGGKSFGPHGFLVDMRNDAGVLQAGIVLKDMGVKTTGNDLDNAEIKFDKMEIPKSSLLSRFADIRNDQYVQTTKEKMRIEVIGQRLLTGRVAVAQAALQFTRQLYAETKKYAENKKCWAPGATPSLIQIPHLAALFREAEDRLALLDSFMFGVEAQLSKCLLEDRIPPPDVVQSIAVGKVQAVEHSISLCFRLKQEVGSYALMAGNGFENMDFLQCCKFAEGDSVILKLKLARDEVRAYGTKVASGNIGTAAASPEEARLCKILTDAGRNWDTCWREGFELADLILARTVKQYTGKPIARL